MSVKVTVTVEITTGVGGHVGTYSVSREAARKGGNPLFYAEQAAEAAKYATNDVLSAVEGVHGRVST